MRTFLIAAAFASIAACQPAPAAPPEAEPEASPPVEEPAAEAPVGATFTVTDGTGAANLVIDEGAENLLFALDCASAGPALTATGATSQVALGNMVFPYSIVLSGATFEAELVPGDDAAPTFSVTTPLTPEVLSALSGATTARIFVNDGYAFVESGIDTGDAFERFASACADATGIAPAP